MTKVGWSVATVLGAALLVYGVSGYTDQQVVDTTRYQWAVWSATERLVMSSAAALTVAGLIFRRQVQ
jgi:hypothetical protein